MASLARHALYMVRQGLLLNKDLVAPFALDLPIGIVLVHMHAHGRLIRRRVIDALGAHIEPRGRFRIGAPNELLNRCHCGYKY